MRKVYLCILCIILGAACQPAVLPTATIENEEVVPTEQLGEVRRVEDTVQHAAADEPLQPIEDSAPLFPDDQVGVQDRGEALLDFGSQMLVTLFNNSDTTISAEAAEGVPLIVRFVLLRGGLVGEKELDDSRRVQIDTPVGASVTVVGTRFFVTYDANTQMTTVGNFGGSVAVSGPEPTMDISDNTYVVIGPDLAAEAPRQLPMDMDTFAQRARDLGSALEVVRLMESTPTPTGTAIPPTSTPTPSATPTPTYTPSPSSTPTPSLTPTPVEPWATFTTNANCRRGPGTVYEVLNDFGPGTRLRITGREPSLSWYQLDGGGYSCWSASSVITVENAELAPYVPTPPPPPTITPTPTPSPTPTATTRSCGAMRVAVQAEKTGDGYQVAIAWNAIGGCEPITGTVQGQIGQGAPFSVGTVSARTGTVTHRPSLQCEGRVIVRYTVTVYDDMQQRASGSDSVEFIIIC